MNREEDKIITKERIIGFQNHIEQTGKLDDSLHFVVCTQKQNELRGSWLSNIHVADHEWLDLEPTARSTSPTPHPQPHPHTKRREEILDTRQ